ncbi:MAG: hypothetical protein ACTHU0_28935 [Kofleriaceae bacterium]
MRSIAIGVLLLAFAATASAADRKKQHRYIGIHPVAKAAGGGICYIEGPHVHVYPSDKLQYRDHHGHAYFVGDPVAYGYDGPKHVYKGHHPIQVDAVVELDQAEPDVEFCYLDGPHYHAFAPPPGPEFAMSGDAYFYVAAPPKPYIEARPAMVQINAVYKPLVYARPVVEVAAPTGWIGARAEFVAPVVVAPRATIDARIHVPVPQVRFEVGIGVPGVIVHEHHHHGHKKHKRHKKHRWH